MKSIPNIETKFGILCILTICNEMLSWMIFDDKKEKRKNNARTKYEHECKPVSPMLIMVSHDAVWGFMPLLGGWL